MDTVKDFRGKIIQVTLNHYGSDAHKHTGIILKQEEQPLSNSVVFSMMEANGRIFQFSGAKSDLDTIKSVRLKPDERTAFEEAYKAHIKLAAFFEKYNKEKILLQQTLEDKMNILKEFSDELTFQDFSQIFEKLFAKKIGEKYGVHLEYTAGSQHSATISISKDCGKWLDFDSLSFIEKEYDGAYFVDPSVPEYKAYCEKYAPKGIPELDSLYEKTYRAEVGDKRSLYVMLDYIIPLNHGISRSSIKVIERELDKALMENSSIEQKIGNAEERSNKNSKSQKSKNKEISI